MVVPPDDYPGKRYRGRYAYEHHVAWWLKTGETVRDGMVIHHLNHDKTDNSPGNLETMTRAAHNSEHTTAMWREGVLPVRAKS